MSGLNVEMGVQEKMAPEDQHGGCSSHPTTHSCSTPAHTLIHLHDRLHDEFGRCRSTVTSACQHYPPSELAYPASIWLFGCFR